MALKDYFSIFIPSLAFSVALYTFLANNPRFREFSKRFGVFAGLQIIATLLCSTLLLTSQIKLSFINNKGIVDKIEIAEEILTYAAVTFYIFGWFYLCRIFYLIFGSLYFMRKKRFLKYTHLISKFHEKFLFKEQYEVEYRKRNKNNVNMNCLEGVDLSVISNGGSILVLYSDDCTDCIEFINKFIIESIKNKETVDFVTTIEQPIEVLEYISKHVDDDDVLSGISKKMSIIDCFSPYYSFDDKILNIQKKKWINKGFKFFEADSFAGIHSATNSSWYRFRSQCKAEENQFRIPHRTVFHTLSSLIRYSSEEQFFLYLRHVLSSEKSYGMITLLIEPMSLKSDIRSELYQMVDIILEMNNDTIKTKKIPPVEE